jgi:DNA-binding transcriptional LysR family regulator
MQTLSSPFRQGCVQKQTDLDSRNVNLQYDKIYSSDLPFTLDQLRILKAIEITGSFKKAANFLHVSQPTVSARIRSLESQLNLSLFDRCWKHNQLTESGHLVLSYGERILSLCQEACEAFKKQQSFQEDTLHFGATPIPGTYLVPSLLGRFRQKYPKISIQVYTGSTHEICLSVLNSQVNLALIEDDIPSELINSLIVLDFIEDEVVLIVSACHPLAQTGKIQLDELDKIKLIKLDSQPQSEGWVNQVLALNGLDIQHLNVVMKLSCIETIKSAVQANLGAAFVPRSAIDKELQLNVLQHIKIDNFACKKKMLFVTKADHSLPKLVAIFVQTILSSSLFLNQAEPSLSYPFDGNDNS